MSERAPKDALLERSERVPGERVPSERVPSEQELTERAPMGGLGSSVFVHEDVKKGTRHDYLKPSR